MLFFGEDYAMTYQMVKPCIDTTINHIPAGSHICHIFLDDDERNDALLKFLLNGLKLGDCAACISQKANEWEINTYLSHHDLSYGELLNSGAFILSDSSEVYFQNNFFNPDRMIEFIGQYYTESKALGFSDAWVIGEIPLEIQKASGGSRLLEYEHRLSLLLDEYPAISVCQYDARYFDGPTIMGILKAHPLMVVQGAVVRNPLFSHFSEVG
jgi:hypothetical protein